MDGPDFPELLSHVWLAFISLVGRKGDSLLSYTEVKSWMDVTGNTLKPWEVEAIMELDLIHTKVTNNV